MAVGEGSVNHPKNLRSRDDDDLGHVIDVDFIGKILVFDDISNVEKKCDHSNLLVSGFIVISSNFLPQLQPQK